MRKVQINFCLALMGVFASGCLAAAEPVCVACHKVDFANTIHGRAFAEPDEGQSAARDCTSCHGDGQAHIASPTQPGSINRFGDAQAASNKAVCVACHKDESAPTTSPHGRTAVACTDCHTIHQSAAHGALPAPEDAGQTSLSKASHLDPASLTCASCHEDTLTEFGSREGHRLFEGAVSCTSCHDPHAPRVGNRLGGFADSKCATCHAAKAGPFVFEHAASRVEGCTACHAPHGSPNRHMLSHQATGELCYTCHANVPQFHLGFSPVAAPRFDERTVCTNCHVAIHGSNLDRLFLR